MKHTNKIYFQDISNEIHNRKGFIFYKPQHTQAVLNHHQDMVKLREKIFMGLQATRSSKKKFLIVTAAIDDDAVIALVELQNTM